MPSTKLFSATLHGPQNQIIQEHHSISTTPNTDTRLNTFVRSHSQLFSIRTTNLGIQPSIFSQEPQSVGRNSLQGTIGRLVAIVSFENRMVHAFTVNNLGQQYVVPETLCFPPDEAATLSINIWRVKIFKEVASKDDSQMVAVEQSVDGTLNRSLVFAIDSEQPIISFNITHDPNFRQVMKPLGFKNFLAHVRLASYFDAAGATSETFESLNEIKHVNIFKSKKRTINELDLPLRKRQHNIEVKTEKSQPQASASFESKDTLRQFVFMMKQNGHSSDHIIDILLKSV